jgi:hypothetical protein
MLARYMFSISLRNSSQKRLFSSWVVYPYMIVSWDWEMQQDQHGIGACVSAFA